MENLGETSLTKAANGGRLNSDDFAILIYFAYIQLIRTPSFLKLTYRYINHIISDNVLEKMFNDAVEEYEVKIRNKRPINEGKSSKTSADILMPIKVRVK